LFLNAWYHFHYCPVLKMGPIKESQLFQIFEPNLTPA
jgi:hypothetical protein